MQFGSKPPLSFKLQPSEAQAQCGVIWCLLPLQKSLESLHNTSQENKQFRRITYNLAQTCFTAPRDLPLSKVHKIYRYYVGLFYSRFFSLWFVVYFVPFSSCFSEIIPNFCLNISQINPDSNTNIQCNQLIVLIHVHLSLFLSAFDKIYRISSLEKEGSEESRRLQIKFVTWNWQGNTFFMSAS